MAPSQDDPQQQQEQPEKPCSSIIDPIIVESDFCSQSAPRPLRICCYGSSSSLTPEKYMKEARSLGYILARRGHTCVNGAGSFGCMAAMNDGAVVGNGHVVGVIHEMWVVDGSDNYTWENVRDGGAHQIFTSNVKDRDGPIREFRIAHGNDLQERKKLLVEGADALVVLPGGPGTWDELWEMACARNIGLSKLPIVCVNVNGYYESFRLMLNRANEDQLIKNPPDDILHFEPTAEAAIRWVESQCAKVSKPLVRPKRRQMRQTSFFTPPVVESFSSWLRNSLSWESGAESDDGKTVVVARRGKWLQLAVTFSLGLAVGATVARRSRVGRS